MRVDEGTVFGAGVKARVWGAEGGFSEGSSEERGGVGGMAAEEKEGSIEEEEERTKEREGSMEEREGSMEEREGSMEEKEGSMEEKEEKATPARKMKTVKSRYPIIEQLLLDC